MKKTITLILLCLSLHTNAKMLTRPQHFPTPEEVLGTSKKEHFPTPQEVLGNDAINKSHPVLLAQLSNSTEPQSDAPKPTYVIDWNKVWTITLWIAGIGLLVLGFFKRKYIANRMSIKWTLAGMAIIATFFLVTNPSQSDFEKYVKYQIGNDLVRDKKKGELFTTRTSYCLVYSVYEYKYFSGSQLVKHGTYYGFLKTFK